MAHSHRTSYQTPPRARAKPLEHLERMPSVYFFTPDLEREINQLDGVSSCRVLSTGADIEEIHVIAPPDRTPKKIVRDIESLLLVRFGIRIDHRKVSVVQMGEGKVEPEGPIRPKILSITRRPSESGAEVCVEVRVGDRIIEGVGRAEAGESELWASSRALVSAIEKLLNTQGALSVEGISAVQADSQQIVLAVLRWTLGGQAEILVGATVARSDPLEDAARATFDAMNRRLVRAYPGRFAKE